MKYVVQTRASKSTVCREIVATTGKRDYFDWMYDLSTDADRRICRDFFSMDEGRRKAESKAYYERDETLRNMNYVAYAMLTNVRNADFLRAHAPFLDQEYFSRFSRTLEPHPLDFGNPSFLKYSALPRLQVQKNPNSARYKAYLSPNVGELVFEPRKFASCDRFPLLSFFAPVNVTCELLLFLKEFEPGALMTMEQWRQIKEVNYFCFEESDALTVYFTKMRDRSNEFEQLLTMEALLFQKMQRVDTLRVNLNFNMGLHHSISVSAFLFVFKQVTQWFHCGYVLNDVGRKIQHDLKNMKFEMKGAATLAEVRNVFRDEIMFRTPAESVTVGMIASLLLDWREKNVDRIQDLPAMTASKMPSLDGEEQFQIIKALAERFNAVMEANRKSNWSECCFEKKRERLLVSDAHVVRKKRLMVPYEIELTEKTYRDWFRKGNLRSEEDETVDEAEDAHREDEAENAPNEDEAENAPSENEAEDAPSEDEADDAGKGKKLTLKLPLKSFAKTLRFVTNKGKANEAKVTTQRFTYLPLKKSKKVKLRLVTKSGKDIVTQEFLNVPRYNLRSLTRKRGGNSSDAELVSKEELFAEGAVLQYTPNPFYCEKKKGGTQKRKLKNAVHKLR